MAIVRFSNKLYVNQSAIISLDIEEAHERVGMFSRPAFQEKGKDIYAFRVRLTYGNDITAYLYTGLDKWGCKLRLYEYVLLSSSEQGGILEFSKEDEDWLFENRRHFFTKRKLLYGDVINHFDSKNFKDINKLLDTYKASVRQYILVDRFKKDIKEKQ